MRYSITLVPYILLAAAASPAAAQTATQPNATSAIEASVPLASSDAESGCHSVSASAGVYSAYVLQDIGVLADEKPVVQADVTLSCANGLSFNLWTSTALDAAGPYGNRGYGDEIDITVSYNHTLKTGIGPVNIEASAAYYVVADFATAKDDILQLYVQAGRPIKVASATVTPYVRLQEWVGIGNFPNATFVRSGAQLNVPLSAHLSLEGDLSEVFGLSKDGENITRAQLSVTRSFDHGWSITAGTKLTEHVKPVFWLSVSKQF